VRRALILAVNLAFSTVCSVVSSGLADAPCVLRNHGLKHPGMLMERSDSNDRTLLEFR